MHSPGTVRLLLALLVFTLTTRAAQGGELVAWGSNSASQCEVPAGKTFTAVAAGKYHNLTLKSNGSLVSWGDNTYKQVANTPTGDGFSGVACGDYHSLAWKADGTLFAWGRNHFGQTTLPDCNACAPVTLAVCGANHTLVLRSDGTVQGWGSNDEGQSIIPPNILFETVAAGGKHNIGIRREDQHLLGWGWNVFSQASFPAELHGQIDQVDCGEYHSLALKKDGLLTAWGLNSHQQAAIPAALASRRFLAISAGDLHNMALTEDYTVVAWGNTPTGGWQTPERSDFVRIAAGGYHCVGIVDPRMNLLYPNGGESFRGNERIRIEWEAWDATVVRIEYSIDNGATWLEITATGSNDHFDWLVPQTFSEQCLVRISDAAAPAVSDQSGSVFAIYGSGVLAGWGSNTKNQIAVPDGDNIVALATGSYHGLALRSDGSLVSWGSHEAGSDGNHVVNATPAGNNFAAVAAGAFHSLALRQDGTLAGWGYNFQGQTNVPAGNDYIAIAAGGFHSMALRLNGTVAVWGSNDKGQVTGALSGTYRAIAAGYNFCLAIDSATGQVVGWGANDKGQVGLIPAGTRFVEIAGGQEYAVGIDETGALRQWGTGDNRPAETPAASNFIKISANKYHAMALNRAGQIVCWGNGALGRLQTPAHGRFLAVAAGLNHSLAIAEPRIELLDPNGAQTILAQSQYPILWQTHIQKLQLEFSPDGGATWQPIGSNPITNTGSHLWTVPDLESQTCRVRIGSHHSPASFFALSPGPFSIYRCRLQYDLNRDCLVNLADLALFTTEWLRCGNPYDPACQEPGTPPAP